MTDAIVIGAGVVGAAVAYRLAEAGLRVTVLEANRVGGGTSGTSFAWTNANNKPPKPYHDLNVAGMRAHAALRDEFGEIPWWHGGGSVDWFGTAAEQQAQRAKVEQLRAWGYAAQWITPAELKELEPDIDLATVRDAPIAYYPEEGWLDPVPYAHAMLAAAICRGATLRQGAPVEKVHIEGGRVRGVSVAGGGRFSADLVANCAGRWADRVAEMADVKLPLTPTVGLLVFTPPVATSLRRIVRSPRIHMRPDGAGRLMLHIADGDDAVTADTESTVGLPIARDMVRRAAAILPSIAGAEPEAVRIAVRPIPADGLSTVGPVPGLEGYYVVVTHSGVTLSPYLGRVVAEEIAHGRTVPELEPFRPSRFPGLNVAVAARA
jgi:glycine/D-amino acid oxidase-like deaminating enzyme